MNAPVRHAELRRAWLAAAALSLAVAWGAGAPANPASATVPANIYTIVLSGAAADEADSTLRAALAAAPENATVAIDLRMNGGNPGAAVNMLERLSARRAHGTVLVYAREAVGPGVLLLAAADRLYAPADATLGPGGDAGLPLPVAQLEKLTAPAPRRVEVVRAFFERDLSLAIGGETLKKPGERLTLTGAAAARATGQPPAPLLVNEAAPTLAAALASYLDGHSAQILVWGAGGFTAKPDAVAKVPQPGGPAARPVASAPPPGNKRDEPATADGPARVSVYVVPIKDDINVPQLYILRRALKQAIENKVDTVILDMDTYGGDLGTTLEMMEALAKFEGRSYTFVNDKAVSAGSYIAVATDEIYFAPTGRIGAAEVVSGEGADVPESMKRKIDSFLRATVSTYAGSSRYRADVQRAMMDASFELEVDGKIIKAPGELLTLTAKQACEKYGEPPEGLLGAGIAADIPALLKQLYGENGYMLKEFHLTWSEQLAKWLNAISPILMAAGILLLVIEFKTPGFGIMGIGGICLLLIVLASHYVAALAGYEPILLFALGIICIALEIFVFTGSMLCGVLGLVCLFGSFIWAMTDVWPGEAFGGVSMAGLSRPVVNLALALVLAGGGFLLALRFLPQTWFYSKLMNAAVVPQENLAAASGAATATGATTLPEAGARGTAVTDLRPLGEVEIAGGRYQARACFGEIARGSVIEVVSRKDFSLAVKALSS